MKIISLAASFMLFSGLLHSQDPIPIRHIPKGDELKTYRYTGEILGHKIWGFITGHNIFRDYEWAEKYEIKGKADVYKILSHHDGLAKVKTKKAEFRVYNVDSKGLPKDTLGVKKITYGDLNLGGETTTVFDKPIPVEDEFFVSFYVADYAHDPQTLDKDTMIIYTSKDGSRSEEDLKVYGRNVVRQHDGTAENGRWTDMATELEYSDLEAYLALFPVVKFEDNSVEENFISKAGIVFKPIGISNTTNEVVLNFELKSHEDLSVELLDASGRLIKSVNIGSFGQGNHSTRINLEDVNSGLFILSLSNGKVKLAQSFTFQNNK